jgi:hypothetical protein
VLQSFCWPNGQAIRLAHWTTWIEIFGILSKTFGRKIDLGLDLPPSGHFGNLLFRLGCHTFLPRSNYYTFIKGNLGVTRSLINFYPRARRALRFTFYFVVVVVLVLVVKIGWTFVK